MSASSNTRRDFLKRAGLGAGLAGSGMLGAASPSGAAEDRVENPPAVRSKTKQLVKTDVLVVGGGPAGIGAALGAARTGVKTLLIESCGFFGGVAAWSLGMPINQMRPESKPRSVVHELVIDKLLAYGDQAVYIGQHQLYCNVDYLKVAVLDALDEVGCKYVVHLSAADALMEGNRVTGVVVPTKQGLATISAKVVVDCTGDADVAYFAGAETMMETEEPRMPNTMLLAMAAGKSMGNCVATGHAAGLAAAMSARKGIVPRELKVGQLQDALRKDGVDLTAGGKVQENVSGDRGV